MTVRGASAELDRQLAEVLPLIKAVLRRKSGMSLADDDARPDNVDAIELYHDAMARVWERLREGAAAGSTGEVGDLKAYAAAVAHNAWSDYLREKYPKRASLKNRLRYFLSHQPRYAVWEALDGEGLGGWRKWLLNGAPPRTEGLAGLRAGTAKLPAGSLPRRDPGNYTAEDWDRLLAALFNAVGGPATLDELVSVIAQLTGLKEDRVESLDDDADEESGRHELAADEQATPERIAEMRSTLVRLWAAILRLKSDHRCAYLLNIPGPGKSRGEIDVFPLHGVATIAEIGQALKLNARQFDIVWSLVELTPDDRGRLAELADGDAQFATLWNYLPLDDMTIGRVLGLERQQVINRRMLALRDLARALSGAPDKKNPPAL
jgi:DNA-directed RNA polymerase specialized sigma24 family protein